MLQLFHKRYAKMGWCGPKKKLPQNAFCCRDRKSFNTDCLWFDTDHETNPFLEFSYSEAELKLFQPDGFSTVAGIRLVVPSSRRIFEYGANCILKMLFSTLHLPVKSFALQCRRLSGSCHTDNKEKGSGAAFF